MLTASKSISRKKEGEIVVSAAYLRKLEKIKQRYEEAQLVEELQAEAAKFERLDRLGKLNLPSIDKLLGLKNA